MVHTYEIPLGGRTLTIETGRVAEQANGAVLVRYGDTVVLVTATASREPREGIDFFPLTVDFEPRMYAAGRIPGLRFARREGRPPDEAILAGRLTDRSIRPLFPKGFHNDVQVIITVLSADPENDPDVLGIVGASSALMISDIPFHGPVGAVRVGRLHGRFVVNPTFAQREESDIDLVVAGTADAVIMVEAGMREVPEADALEAIRFGHTALQDIIRLQQRMAAEVGKPKMAFHPHEIPAETRAAVAELLGDRLAQALNQPDKTAREAAVDALHAEVLATLGATGQHAPADLEAAFEELMMNEVRSAILERGVRPDGRDPKTIRPITCEVGLLPRTHGSALFTRGQTQVLSVVTLGSLAEAQTIEGLAQEETKRFIHHYNMPPYATGEVRPLRAPGRREIGHGRLAERALEAVIPSEEEFPYTIRIVSEVLSSNGSTSMGSVCGSTLALMDAGVPIKAPVAGVAMGLVMGLKRLKAGAELDLAHGGEAAEGQVEPGARPAAAPYVVLTDIQGIEDALGDMDFKVAGTAKGITALQMDIKITGLTFEILADALEQARQGRMYILNKMLETIAEPRPQLRPHAPRVLSLKIDPDKIGAIIGPGGKTIRRIEEETGASITIEPDGTVTIAAPGGQGVEQAANVVRGLAEEVEVGKIYLGKVTRILPFGAFVEILPGKEGLVHISQLADYRVSRVEDVVSIGDEINVMVTEIDSQGRINLSRRAVLEGTPPAAAAAAVRSAREPAPAAPSPRAARPAAPAPAPQPAPRRPAPAAAPPPQSQRRPEERPPRERTPGGPPPSRGPSGPAPSGGRWGR
jgi:polyribonucleotide nucleotidyltransferase